MNDDQYGDGNRYARRVIAATALLATALPLSAQQDGSDAVTHLAGGKIRYLEAPRPTPAAALGRSALTEAGLRNAVAAALQTYGGHFGVNDASRELELLSSQSLGTGDSVWRHRQVHAGIPVLGAELVSVLDDIGLLHTMSGEILENPSVATLVPSIGAAEASATALALAAKHHSVGVTQLLASLPELSLYEPSLLGLESGSPTALVWRVEVTAVDPAPIRQLVLVDAGTGAVALTFNQAETARNRLTYTSGNATVLPGTLLCNEGQANCTNGANTDADAAHRYAGQMYDFYFTNHERDSFNDRGATITSSVRYVYPGCPNAFWNSTQMVYCAGAAQADDVVGHELTHAVTESTSNLLYYYQSGAINESFSDVWGEFLDLTNASGTDTAQTRWLMGEDFVGAIRNMANPPQFNDPDRMRSTLYWASTGDNGGVHTNSGVNNKAAALLVDGGQFNGFTINPIGLFKTAALYYRVQTQHLGSGSDYADLGLALTQACQNLIGGSAGITPTDCVQVANAVLAVEMQLEPTAFQDLDAAVCPVGQSAQDVFVDDFEVAAAVRWQSVALAGASPWTITSEYAASPRLMYSNLGSTAASDIAGTMINGVVVPANGRLHFRHAFDLEANTSSTPPAFYDGAVVEYSTDNGATWQDLGPLHSAGVDYEGALDNTSGNPLGGRNAFVSRSGGYMASRYDLSSLAGQSIRVRFRLATDTGTRAYFGWAVDDVRVYSCAAGAPANQPPVANAGPDQMRAAATTVTLNGAASTDPDGSIAASQWLQTGGPVVALSNGGLGLTVTFVAPTTPAADILTFRLAVRDNAGATGVDDVRITVATTNLPPVANAGPDQAVRPQATVNLAGSGTDTDGTIASFSWVQVGGPVATLNNATTATPSFTAPTVLATTRVVVRLTVTDNLGGTDTDDVAITITNEPPVVNAGTDRTARPRETVSLTGSATDNDGTIATYAWSQVSGPSVSLTGAGTTSVSFTAPSVTLQQIVTLRLTATDTEGGSGFDDVRVTINNAQPVVNAGVDRVLRTRQPATVAATASDTDGSIVSYAWTQTLGPAVQLAGAATGTVTFTTPSVVTQQAIGLRLAVTDNDGATVVDDVFVWSFNDQPVVNAGPDVPVEPGVNVTLTATATDANGTIVSYAWQQTGGPAMTLTGVSTRTAQFVAPTAATASVLTFRVTVTDQDNASATDTVVVTALGINLRPTADAGADQNLKPRRAVTLTGAGTDPDGTVASYAWTQTSGPTAQITGASTATPRVTLPAVPTSATLVLRLTVTDNRGGTATDELSISTSNDAPTVDAGTDLSQAAGASVTLTAAGSDPDGAIASYRWEQTGGPGVALIGATSQSVTFAAPSLSTASQVTLRVTATDADGATATDTVVVSVDAQPPPPQQSSGGGGGAMGIVWVLALLGALGLRRRRLLS